MKALGSVKHAGPSYQHAADWRDLPGIVHRGIHVVLPSVQWSNVLWPSLGTSVFSLHVVWRHCFHFLFWCPRLLSRLSPRFFPSSWPGTAPFRSCLSMPPGNICHAGGWHLRRMPRVVLLFRLHPCLFGLRCALTNSDSLRRISIQGLPNLFFTHYVIRCCL